MRTMQQQFCGERSHNELPKAAEVRAGLAAIALIFNYPIDSELRYFRLPCQNQVECQGMVTILRFRGVRRK